MSRTWTILNGGQNDMVLLKHLHLDGANQQIQLVSGAGVRHLNLPEDKVIPIRIDIKNGSDASHMADGYAPLRRAEIDPDVGLGYCQQNDQLYQSVLREYEKSAEEKTQDAQKYYENRDWQNYSVIAHAIKSSSRTIGATTLAEMAARLEAAAEESREQPVVFEHDAMLQRFQMTVQAIQQLLGDEVVDSANQEEDEILEFMPDNI